MFPRPPGPHATLAEIERYRAAVRAEAEYVRTIKAEAYRELAEDLICGLRPGQAEKRIYALAIITHAPSLREMNQSKVAKRLGISRQRLSEIIDDVAQLIQ